MEVTGKNLLNVCKLLFSLARTEDNDQCFHEDAIAGILPSNLDTIGPGESILIREVSLFQGLKHGTCIYLWRKKVSCLERCPYFRGVLIEEFHCMFMNQFAPTRILVFTYILQHLYIHSAAPLVDILGGCDAVSDSDVLVYGVGTVKLLASNRDLRLQLAKCDTLSLLLSLLQCYNSQQVYTVEPLYKGRIILSIIERLSSFRGKNALPLYRLVYWIVSFIQRCIVSFIQSVLYQRFHYIQRNVQ